MIEQCLEKLLYNFIIHRKLLHEAKKVLKYQLLTSLFTKRRFVKNVFLIFFSKAAVKSERYIELQYLIEILNNKLNNINFCHRIVCTTTKIF